MVDILNEQRLSLSQLARQEGKSPPTIWRWSGRGIKGVVLETFSVGGRRYTTAESFQRFVERVTAIQHCGANAPTTPPPRTSRQIEAAMKRAERSCKSHGI